jgi:hypothetical protein
MYAPSHPAIIVAANIREAMLNKRFIRSASYPPPSLPGTGGLCSADRARDGGGFGAFD